MSRFVIPLEDPDAKNPTLTGGKGANLARLIEADFPVPPSVCVATTVYQAIIDTSDIRTTIESLETLGPEDTEAIAELSAEVRSKIQQRNLPEPGRSAVMDALDTLSTNAYAVRSSATAEDLPTASFAGQHETFLGVNQQAAVLDRIHDCLASLFTDRAVTYRLRNGISQSNVAMAVVVQAMVEPAVAGVLFTADPVSGNRHVASVDANFGLGDTVVAGDISPDSARIERRTGKILEYAIGEKSYALRSGADKRGGTEPIDLAPERRESRALSDAQLHALVDLGEQVEQLLDDPQDIEWALVDGDFVLLQSRPITSLYPLPSPLPSDEQLHVYLSFGHAQAMPEAMPPLVVDFWQGFMDGGAAVFRPDDARKQWAVEAGGRIYLDLTPLLHIGPLRRRLPKRIAAANEPASDALQHLLAQRPEAFPDRGALADVRAVVRGLHQGAPVLASVVPRMVGRFVRAFVTGPPNPEREQARIEGWGDDVASRTRGLDTLAGRVRAAFERFDLSMVLTDVVSRVGPLLVASLVAEKVLRRLFPDADTDIDAISKGLEMELVTRMNQRLGDLADIAREHPDVREALQQEVPLAQIEEVEGGRAFVDALETYLDEFGHRASNEIDLSRSRWNDNPEMLLQTIRSDLVQSEPEAHREHLHHLKRNANDAAAYLEARVDVGVCGPLKKAVVRRLIQTYRGGIQLREYPKQGVAHLFAAVHEEISDAGASLAVDGRLDRPDDVWYLRKDELLAALEEDAPIDADVEARRRTHDRYTSMTAPPILTSEGEAPTEPEDTTRSEGVLTGTPVSAGIVEGLARVIRDPSGESLKKGEILVAPATDPGWTPLFLNAAGLVMEAGGRMTHGALVAREYGIPAVAAVSEATTTIQTGERIRIDGKRGTVELLTRD